MDEKSEQRFWSRVDRSGDCWIWTGYTDPKGYGRVGVNGKTALLTHRVSWELHNGSIPDGLWVLHKCDNPPCCNPSHLFLGTALDNTTDAAKKGRLSRQPRHFGEGSPGARLNDQLVREIRGLHASGEWSYGRLAAQFGVSRGAIKGLLKGRTWKHVQL